MELSHLYQRTERESERLSQFTEDFSSAVAGYMNSTAEDTTGIPMYIGKEVTTEDIAPMIEDAEASIAFVEARNGQLAYCIEQLRRRNDYNSIEVEGKERRPSKIRRELSDRFDDFTGYEDRIETGLETVTYSSDTPFDPVDLDEASAVSDFDIDDWRFPEENLWPFKE